MELPEIAGLLTFDGKSGVRRYALKKGEWCTVYRNTVGLYRAPDSGIGELCMVIDHDGSKDGIESVIRKALDYYGE